MVKKTDPSATKLSPAQLHRALMALFDEELRRGRKNLSDCEREVRRLECSDYYRLLPQWRRTRTKIRARVAMLEALVERYGDFK